MTRTEFINSIRSKYPQYNNIDDNTLYNKIIEKYPVYKNQITDTQTPKPINQQQTPVQQTNVAPKVTPQQEEPGFFEGVKSFFFGDEQKKPKAELISEKFVEQKPETPYPFSKTTPITVLDKEYGQKIKAVEDKYSKLSYSVDETGYPVKNYNIDLDAINKQKEQEIFNLKVEKLRREKQNLTPLEQEQDTRIYQNKIQANKTTIENKAKEKKSYLDELKKVEVTDEGFSSLANVFKTVKNTWDHNSEVDKEISQAETAKNENQKVLDFVGKGVNPFKNRDYNNAEDMKKAGSYIDASIESGSKTAREKIGEITTKYFPSAEGSVKEKGLGLRLIDVGLKQLNPFLPAVKDIFFSGFVKKVDLPNFAAEQFEKTALDKSYRLAANNLDNSLTPLYDKIQSEIGIPKSEVVGKIDIYLTAKKEREEGLYPNIGKLSENDIKLFNNPNFQNIADTYSKSAITTIRDGKWKLLSLANVDIYNEEKAKAFGTINKVENIGRKEAVRTAILDKCRRTGSFI
jgi:hypothetical protein